MGKNLKGIMMRLSEHFELWEFTKSATADKKGINNSPNEAQIQNLRLLCKYVLEPLRAETGIIEVTSGFRSLELNKAVGGVATSQHTLGQAADIIFPEYNIGDAFRYIRDNLIYDQVIWENKFGNVWIHVSYEHGANRKEPLKAIFKKGQKTQYVLWTKEKEEDFN
jgi:zinc D-Ala-D-Ala carboxypeptidase